MEASKEDLPEITVDDSVLEGQASLIKRLTQLVSSTTTELQTAYKEMEELNHRLTILSNYDALTGLNNRRHFEELETGLLEKCREEKKPISFIMMDIDYFKSVNDTLGHGIGDDTIKFVAESIRNVFRDTDYIGRMGGDEFMVLMSHTTPEVAAERAKRLNDKIRSDVTDGKESVHISCSIGIAFYAKDGEDYDTLFRAADNALYEAKEAGKDCYRIYEAD